MEQDVWSMHNRSTCLSSYSSYTPVIVAVNMVTSVAAILGNTLVIVSLIKFRRLHSTTNLFVASLAASDLLVGFMIPYYVIFYFDVEWACDFYPCLLRYSLALYATFLSLLSVTGVAVDRYVAILHPLSYHSIITPRRAKLFILTGWLYLATISLLPILGVNTWNRHKEMTCDLFYVVSLEYVLGASVAHLLFAIIVTMGAYGRVFRTALKQRRAVAIMDQRLDLQVRLRREKRITVTMVLVLGMAMFGMIPYLISIVLRYTDWAPQECWCKLKQITVCLYLGKSCMNPIIYGWRNAEFRSAFAQLMWLKNKKSEEHSFVTIADIARTNAVSERTLRECH